MAATLRDPGFGPTARAAAVVAVLLLAVPLAGLAPPAAVATDGAGPVLPVAGRLPSSRTYTSAVGTDQAMYIFGGDFDSGSRTDAIERFDPATGLVQTMGARLPEVRDWTSAVWDGTFAWIFGGNNHGYRSGIERYDPATDQLVRAGDLPVPRCCTSAVWHGGAAYIFGGADHGCCGNPTDEILRFSPGVGAAPVGARLPQRLCCTAAATDGNAIFVFGGETSNPTSGVPSDRVYRYDPGADALTELPGRLPVAASAMSAAWVGDRVHLFGGYTGGGAFNDHVVAFDPATGTAALLAERLPAPRYGTSAAVVGGRAYVAGGGLLQADRSTWTTFDEIVGIDACGPRGFDADGDALPDCWETDGVDLDGDGAAELDLAALGADPRHKDLFLEIDYMDCARGGCGFLHQLLGGSHRPTARALDLVARAFAAAPATNPDGRPGIRLHVDLDEPLPEVTPLRFFRDTPPGATPAGSFDALKCGFDDCRAPPLPCRGHFGTPADRGRADCAAILAARAQVYRYAIFGHAQATAPGFGGIAEMDRDEPGFGAGNDLLITLGEWTVQNVVRHVTDGQAGMEAGVLMHELGHTLGLAHGGGDGDVCKPNYLSVMNYALMSRALDPTRPLDYSRQELPTLDEHHLNELVGVQGPFPRLTVVGRLGIPSATFAFAPIYYNLDPFLEADVAWDVNHIRQLCPGGAGLDSELRGHDDWANLDFDFRDHEIASVEELMEITPEQLLEVADLVDFDGDGPSNLDDDCPADAEDANGVDDGDGCPEVALSVLMAEASMPPSGPWTRGLWSVDVACEDCTTEFEVDRARGAFEQPVIVALEGLHAWRHQASDLGGHREPWQHALLGVDLTPPATTPQPTATLPPAGPWTAGEWHLALPCKDPLAGEPPGASGCAGTILAVDGGSPVAANEVALVEEGRHEVAFRSDDAAGNAEPEQAIELHIDRTPPVPVQGHGDEPLLMAVFAPPAQPVRLQAHVAPDMAGEDLGSGTVAVCFEIVALAGAAPSECVQAVQQGEGIWSAAPDLELGVYDARARATDLVGNSALSGPLTVVVLAPPAAP